MACWIAKYYERLLVEEASAFERNQKNKISSLNKSVSGHEGGVDKSSDQRLVVIISFVCFLTGARLNYGTDRNENVLNFRDLFSNSIMHIFYV